MAFATATCPRCGRENDLPACPNDGSLAYHFGDLSDGSQGMICDRCNLGSSIYHCQFPDCNGVFAASLFGTPFSRTIRKTSAGIEAYQGGKCFIATELYGEDSVEVAILRQFRDVTLMPEPVGRTLVATYYRAAPHVVRLMRRSRVIRAAVGSLVATAIRFVRAHERGSTVIQPARPSSGA